MHLPVLPPSPMSSLGSATGPPSYQMNGGLSEVTTEPTNASGLTSVSAGHLSFERPRNNGEDLPQAINPPSSVSATTPRKHVKTTTTNAMRRASSAEKPKSPPSVAPPFIPTRETISNDKAVEALRAGVHFVLDILSSACRMLKAPLAFLIFLWFLAIAVNTLKPSFRNAFGPACFIPGISSTSFCRYLEPSKGNPQRADYPKLIDVQCETFDHVLSEGVSGSVLALEIKDAEMATSSLVILIRTSDLKDRDHLANKLEELVQRARKTAIGLQRLNAKVGGAVDRIIAVNNYALRTIEEVTRESKSSSLITFIWPFSLTSAERTNKVITKQFIYAFSELDTQMWRLIHEAEMSMKDLNHLEEGMKAFHEDVVGKEAALVVAQSQLLAEMWTRLGGKKATLRKQERHLHILRNAGTYTQQALTHVSRAWVALHGMMEQMEDIKASVSKPEDERRTPIEVHVESIKAGLDGLLDKLQQGKRRALEREDEAYMKKAQSVGY